jgi:hypothetical protein
VRHAQSRRRGGRDRTVERYWSPDLRVMAPRTLGVTAMDDERRAAGDEIRVVLVDDHELVSQAVADSLADRPGIAVVGRGVSHAGWCDSWPRTWC